MTYACQKELDFLMLALKKLRLQGRLLHPGCSLAGLDHGLRSLLGLEEDYVFAYQIGVQWHHERTIFKILDQFMCHYIYFRLPGAVPPTALFIGPYLTIDPSRGMILEQAERLGLPLNTIDLQADYYASLPVFNDPSIIMALISAFGETLWGDPGRFDIVDVNYESSAVPLPTASDDLIEQTSILRQMKQMEERYAYENELMEIVARGLTNRAEVMMSSVSSLNYQQRLADPLRNMKNYCIICNTLLRKAAERGGVHPLHLDRISSQYARSIENSPTLEDCSGLIVEMIRTYCRLVRTHSHRHYSAIVQKCLTYIEANLSGDLSLATLAGLLQVSPSYLSALFHRETGRTLADHIADVRMKAALQLLRTTQLQVQSIAQLTGFSDPNYFGKRFRQFYGVTPLQYRREQRRPAQEERP